MTADFLGKTDDISKAGNLKILMFKIKAIECLINFSILVCSEFSQRSVQQKPDKHSPLVRVVHYAARSTNSKNARSHMTLIVMDGTIDCKANGIDGSRIELADVGGLTDTLLDNQIIAVVALQKFQAKNFAAANRLPSPTLPVE